MKTGEHMKKIAVLLLLLLLTACGKGKARRYEATFLTLFDTVTTIVGYSGSREAFAAQAQKIYDQLAEYHRLFDVYHTYEGINNLKTVNDRAGTAPVKVDKRIIDLLLTAKGLYQRTGGKVNVAFGSVLSVWHDYRERGISDPARAALPSMELLRAAAEHTDISRVKIDEKASTVFLEDPEMRLDVGAIAKGYAVEQVCGRMRREGVSVLVSVGGNVCAAGGMGKGPWRTGVQDPRQSGEALCILGLRDMSLVSSGSCQRYYTVEEKQYHHIIDPDTLMPAGYFLAVTVLAKDSGLADALSTALFNMPLRQGLALAEELPDVEALWITLDGSLWCSSGFQKYAVSKR